MTQEILNANPPDLVPNVVEEDRVLWPSNTGVYTSKSAWKAIRTVRPNVTCTHIVWFPQHTSRWSILWMACHGRLLAKDRLASWGVISDDNCALCYMGKEPLSHLFFECHYSCAIWSYFMQKCGHSDFPQKFALDWMGDRAKGKTTSCIVLRLVFSAFVYHLWRERNDRVFQLKKGSVEALILGSRAILELFS